MTDPLEKSAPLTPRQRLEVTAFVVSLWLVPYALTSIVHRILKRNEKEGQRDQNR